MLIPAVIGQVVALLLPLLILGVVLGIVVPRVIRDARGLDGRVNWKPTGQKQVVLSIMATVIAFGLGYGLARLIGNHSPGPLAAGLMFGVIMFVTTMFRIRQDK